MRTFKRNTPDIDTDLDNYNKYFNQMEFKGITEDDNIYAIDQESFKDCKNVYVNFHERLASRPTLQKDTSLPDNIKELLDVYKYDLINVYSIGIGKIYAIQNPANNLYSVIIVNDNIEVLDDTVLALEELPKYEIAIIEHYVICFNNKAGVGAQVYDTNNPDKGWSSLENYVDIPVIKRVVGSTETTYDKNGFTDSYKEEYIWSNESKPTLPSGNAEVTVNTSSKKFQWNTISGLDKLPEYLILKGINIPTNGLITSAKDRICVAYNDYFLLSQDDGLTYSKHYYPLYQGTFLNIASISKDGLYFFFVTSYGVYRCNLGDYTWADVIRANTGIDVPLINENQEVDISYTGFNNSCYFLTGDIFSFCTWNGQYQGTMKVYVKGPGLAGEGKEQAKDDNGNSLNLLYEAYSLIFSGYQSTHLDKDQSALSMYMYLTKDVTGLKDVAVSIMCRHHEPDITIKTNKAFIYYLRGEAIKRFYTNTITNPDVNYYGLIELPYTYTALSFANDEINTSDELKVIIKCTSFKNTIGANWEIIQGNLSISKTTNPILTYNEISNTNTNIPSTTNGILYTLQYAYIIDTGNNFTLFYIENDQQYSIILPKSYIGGINNIWIDRGEMWIDGNNFYIVGGDGNIYTNNLADTDIASIIYSYIGDTKFLKVPNVTYSDTELYLAFNNLLQITANNKEGTDIKFNLPKINDQSFISQITGMINISTTEVALFFKDKITICSKVADENLPSSYRYDYYNTKLSTGIRLGDTPINTLEGSYTLFPTLRGLAAMNYQAFMATTDQTLQYLTDKIKHLWEAFYNNSTIIKIIQWRTKLILTNGTGMILLFDLNDNTWWRWEVPLNTEIALTNQIDLSLITVSPGMLTIFKDQQEVVQKDSDGNVIFDNNTGKPATKLIPQYYDFSEIGPGITIEWNVLSQPLHMKVPNYYKNLKQLVFQFYEDSENRTQKTMNAQIKLYRKNITLRAPETIQFTIENLRTFVKRFNYWKINEVQWGLGNDADTSTPKPFEINGISVKYEIGEEVR